MSQSAQSAPHKSRLTMRRVRRKTKLAQAVGEQTYPLNDRLCQYAEDKNLCLVNLD